MFSKRGYWFRRVMMSIVTVDVLSLDDEPMQLTQRRNSAYKGSRLHGNLCQGNRFTVLSGQIFDRNVVIFGVFGLNLLDPYGHLMVF